MASTTGHAGNITPYETMQPKGSVGRVSVTITDQKTGDAIVGKTEGGVHVYQQGYAVELTPGAVVGVSAAALSNDAHLATGANSDVSLRLPSLLNVKSVYPDLKYGDRFMFMITFDSASATTITVGDNGGDETVAYAGAEYEAKSGQKSCLLVRGYYYYDSANSRAALRYGCVWSVDGPAA
jgi:hypothetical protein